MRTCGGQSSLPDICDVAVKKTGLDIEHLIWIREVLYSQPELESVRLRSVRLNIFNVNYDVNIDGVG